MQTYPKHTGKRGWQRCGKCGRFSTTIFSNWHSSLNICKNCNLYIHFGDLSWKEEVWKYITQEVKEKYLGKVI